MREFHLLPKYSDNNSIRSQQRLCIYDLNVWLKHAW
jgi:hypothetical protein